MVSFLWSRIVEVAARSLRSPWTSTASGTSSTSPSRLSLSLLLVSQVGVDREKSFLFDLIQHDEVLTELAVKGSSGPAVSRLEVLPGQFLLSEVMGLTA